LSISYTIQPSHPEAHIFSVTLSVTNPDPAGQRFELPNWIPGSYMIRDFSKNLLAIKASSDGQVVPLQKLDKSSWLAPAGLSGIELSYTVYAWDLSVRAAHLDNEHGFYNGTSVFLCVCGQENSLVTVEMQAPVGEHYQQWHVATAMRATNVDKRGYGLYEAADYDELIDHPVEMGTFERIEFDACGTPHEVILTGEYHCDKERIAKDLKTICEAQIAFFGKPAPVDRYLFMVMVVGDGYGGLEHRASTALLVTRDHLPSPNMDKPDDKYISFLGLCSHEYFHTWNVKRIKPAVFMPFELAAESYTRLLWFFEGATSYYDDLFLVRTGLISTEEYFDLMAKTVTRVQRGAGRQIQSVTDSSFDAWNKFYKQDANAPNAIVSYYAKGALVCLCLDAEIRKATNDTKSLDDVMQQLWSNWLATQNGLSEREPEQIASDMAGVDLHAFFERALYSTEELPLEDSLTTLGASLHVRPRKSVSDTGGGKPDAEPAAPWIGANLDGGAGRIMVTHIFHGHAAEQAGLASGDLIVAINNMVVSATEVPDLLQRHAQSHSLSVHYIRHGVLREAQLPISFAPSDTYSITAQTDPASTWPASVQENQSA
jgi:predicted metalloprotease with PDZ domain